MAQQEQLSRYDQRMYALMNRTEGAPLYRTAARRRAVVGAHVVLTVASVGAWLATVAGRQDWATWVMLALLVPWCVATGTINGATRGLLELRTRALDERQRAERDRVKALAHRIMNWLLFATVVGAGAAQLSGVDVRATVFQLAVGVLVAHWLMPMWVAGLSARDEPEGFDVEE
ncbi:hypothetical protein [Streptomyces lasiicapitis]|uniref:Uncharacterized protein n=1 Tax=Streptomyces lasiicapitis TaxID=1923961 RepID=A0ABQ2LIM3_9ACTN|nr:hypothetical protein [Streptomyces lasiicapitis]GGO35922.1 hypothetical protein GCM10012286_07240 [Streptomyces lasiicapitis]